MNAKKWQMLLDLLGNILTILIADFFEPLTNLTEVKELNVSIFLFVSEKDAWFPLAELLCPRCDRVLPGLCPHDPRRKALQQSGCRTLSKPCHNSTSCSYCR